MSKRMTMFGIGWVGLPAAIIGCGFVVLTAVTLGIPLLAGTVFRWRIPDNRSIDRVVSELLIDGDIRLMPFFLQITHPTSLTRQSTMNLLSPTWWVISTRILLIAAITVRAKLT